VLVGREPDRLEVLPSLFLSVAKPTPLDLPVEQEGDLDGATNVRDQGAERLARRLERTGQRDPRRTVGRDLKMAQLWLGRYLNGE